MQVKKETENVNKKMIKDSIIEVRQNEMQYKQNFDPVNCGAGIDLLSLKKSL